ncbi:arabinofuranosyltransferase [Corynebacterium suedekumii]|nr:arabinofuranosyltransferase [Corynebacterium suedekumii]
MAATLPLAAQLRGTGRYLNGTQGDQSFRLALAEKYSAYWTPVDTYFSDLPSYYPGLWFWGLGRLSAVTGYEVIDLYAFYNLATMAVAVTVNYLLWIAARVERPGIHALTTAVVGTAFAAYEPYSWVLLAQSLPLILLLFRVLDDHHTHTRRQLIVVGLLAGLIAGVALSMYTLAALFAALVVVIALLLHHGRIHWRSAAVVTAVGAVAAAVIAAPWWWGFLTYDGAGAGHGNAAAGYNPMVGASLATALQQPVPWMMLAAAGLVAIALLHDRHPVMKRGVRGGGRRGRLVRAQCGGPPGHRPHAAGVPGNPGALPGPGRRGGPRCRHPAGSRGQARVDAGRHAAAETGPGAGSRWSVPAVITAIIGTVLLQAVPGELATEIEGAKASAGAGHTREVVRCLQEGTGDDDLAGLTVASTDMLLAA